MAKAFRYPPDGALMGYFRDGDFLDSQSVPLPHPAPDAAGLTIAIFFNMPGWARLLLGLRNLLMAPFGLKTGSISDIAPPTRQQINDCTYSGIFAVHSATPTEVILGTNDKHLDFRVSILKDEAADCVSLSTWVRPHNLFGRAYLAVVYPFHRLIVARCLANAQKLGLTVSA
jgi:hypothetical protein